jgi:predicted nucleic acid-binding protein
VGIEADELLRLVNASEVTLLGAIRQEVLCGVRGQARFEQLRQRLAAFSDLPTETSDYEQAAAFYIHCRARGIQGSNTDFLLCAVSARLRCPIYTSDQDFVRFATLLPILLHQVVP